MTVQIPAAHGDALIAKIGALVSFRNALMSQKKRQIQWDMFERLAAMQKGR